MCNKMKGETLLVFCSFALDLEDLGRGEVVRRAASSHLTPLLFDFVSGDFLICFRSVNMSLVVVAVVQGHPAIPGCFQKFYVIFSYVPFLVIFVSLTKAPLPDPTPTPPNIPKRTRNGPKTDPKRSQTEPNGAKTEPNGAEMDRNQAFRGGTGGGVCRGRGGGGL